MQPIRKNFRPTGGAYSDYRPPLLATGPRPLGSMHGNERPSSGARSDEGQPIPLPVGVTARGHQAGFGARDQASEKAEAEKYTALFSRMLQENIFLSGLPSNPAPRAVSPPSSTTLTSSTTLPLLTLPRLNSTQTRQMMLTGSSHQRHPVTPNRMSYQGPGPTTRNIAGARTVAIDPLGWTSSISSPQRLTTRNLPPPPFPPITMTVLPPPSSSPSSSFSVNRLALVAPPGHLHAPAAPPRGVPPPVSSQYHPLPTASTFTPSGPRWSSNPASVLPASSVVNSSDSTRDCFGRTTDATVSREAPEGGGGFLTKSIEGFQSSDILNRVNQMLAQNLFEMTTIKNTDDNNETTMRHDRCSRDSHSTYSSSQGRSEDGGGGRRRRRRRKRSGEEHHKRSSSSGRKRRRKGRRSRSSSSTSAQSTPSSSSSSVVSANSDPQYNTERNYRNRPDDKKPLKKRKSEFCRICEIKIKGSFLAHRRGKAHIRKESSVQSGCDLCGIRCFNTFSEYETHRSSEEHHQRRSEQQNQIDAENRKRLGLPQTKVVIIRNNPDGKEQEEELTKLNRLRKMALDRNRKRISEEEEEEKEGKKQEEEEEEEEERRSGGKIVKETELEHRCSTAIKDGRNSSEWNAGGTNGPELMALVRCHGDHGDDVIIDLTGRSEEERGKQMENVEGSSEVKVAAVKDKEDVTRLTNQTHVTSTTVDKTSKNDCLGREWIVPVTGFFCKVCLKFFSANSGETDVTAHCTSARHRAYYQEHVTRTKSNQSSTTSTSFPSSSSSSSIPSSSSSSSSSTLVNPPNAGRCGIVFDENKRVKEIIIWRNSEK